MIKYHKVPYVTYVISGYLDFPFGDGWVKTYKFLPYLREPTSVCCPSFGHEHGQLRHHTQLQMFQGIVGQVPGRCGPMVYKIYKG